jgi:co-chaperonin GroES (HSP10)
MSSQAKKVTQESEFSVGKVFNYASLSEAFPEVDPGVKPFGDKVCLQIRTPKKMSAGGILLVEETQETELWNTQVAKVIALGPTAFKNADTLEPWPEGDWCKPGMFVRCPKYGGDRWQMPIPGRPGEFALFVQFKELDLTGEITGNPLDIVAYVY